MIQRIRVFLFLLLLMVPHFIGLGFASAQSPSSFAVCPSKMQFDLTDGNAWLYFTERDLSPWTSGTSKPWVVTITDSSSPAQSIKGRIGVAGSGWAYTDAWTGNPNKSALAVEDVYANPGVSLVDAGATNFQTGIHSWTAIGGNGVYTVLDTDSGASVLCIEYVNNSSGAYNFLHATGGKDLTSPLTIGARYLLTMTAKLTGSDTLNIVVNTNGGTDQYSRDVVETGWTDYEIYFTAPTENFNDVRLSDLSGVSLLIKDWDLREIETRSVLGDEEGDPELVVDGGFEIDAAINMWTEEGEWCAGGNSAYNLFEPLGNKAIYQSLITEAGLYRIGFYASISSAVSPMRVVWDGSNEGFISESGSTVIYLYHTGAAPYFGFRTSPQLGFSGGVSNVSVQKVNFEILPYGSNTLEICETDGQTGVSITYVNNASGASIFLNTDGPMDNNFTAGQESSVTVWARVNSGSGVSVSLHNGVEVVDSELVTSTSGTTVVLRGNMQTTSPYLYTPGMGAGEVIFLSRFGAGPKLEPPATGVHIWSGSAQSWKSQDSNFDVYDESGYDVTIKKSGGGYILRPGQGQQFPEKVLRIGGR